MKGSEILTSLPASGNLMPAIWKMFEAGYVVPPVFKSIILKTADGLHSVQVWVATDAIHLGEPGDSFRPMVSAMVEQKVADLLGLYLPTAKIIRAAYQSADIRVPPKLQPSDPADRDAKGYSHLMNDRGAMERHNREVDTAAGFTPGAAAPSQSRIYSSGKGWIVDKKLLTNAGQGCNHGWYTPDAPYKDAKQVPLWQDRGISAHNAGNNITTNPGHFDYSQTASELVYPWVLVDGKDWKDWATVLADPVLGKAVNDDGALPNARPYLVGSNAPLPVLPRPEDPSFPIFAYVTATLASAAAVGGVILLAGSLQSYLR